MPDLSDQILAAFKCEIARYDKPENRTNYQRFFKEPLANPVGLKAPILGKTFASCFRQFGHHTGREIFDACDRILASNQRYARSLAFKWTSNIIDHLVAKDIERFESWIESHVDDWAACDSLCGPLGLFIQKFPKSFSKTYRWTKSKNRWLRRASAVSLIPPLRKGLLLNQAFRTADALLTDPDDIVQKGYGWMLKEASGPFPNETFYFVSARKVRMPRTALRYAIEKMPANWRKELMKSQQVIPRKKSREL
jgi:3-methyladenine DNA glycosylase AlkD